MLILATEALKKRKKKKKNVIVRGCECRSCLASLVLKQQRAAFKATLALAACSGVETDLGADAAVDGVCREGVVTPFFTGGECLLTCSVNSKGNRILQ